MRTDLWLQKTVLQFMPSLFPLDFNTHSSIFKERYCKLPLDLVAGVGFEPTTSGL